MTMTGTKTPTQSMTIVGAVLFLASAIVQQFFGVTIADAEYEDLATGITAIITIAGEVVGAVLAIAGRIRATKKIVPPSKSASTHSHFSIGLVIIAAAFASGCAAPAYIHQAIDGYCGSTTEVQRQAVKATINPTPKGNAAEIYCTTDGATGPVDIATAE